MCQYSYITLAFSASLWWGEISLERSACGENECRKWVKLGENARSPMWKKHQTLLSNNNDGQSITKYGFLVQPHTQIVTLPLPMAWATWAQRLLHGSPWVLKYPYCHRTITQTRPRGYKGF